MENCSVCSVDPSSAFSPNMYTDGIYLYNKYGKPIGWEQWVAIREIIDYVLTIRKGEFLNRRLHIML